MSAETKRLAQLKDAAYRLNMQALVAEKRAAHFRRVADEKRADAEAAIEAYRTALLERQSKSLTQRASVAP